MGESIKRSDNIYVYLDSMGTQVQQYYALREQLTIRKIQRVFHTDELRKFREIPEGRQVDVSYVIKPWVRHSIIEMLQERGDYEGVISIIKGDDTGFFDLIAIVDMIPDDKTKEIVFKEFSRSASVHIMDFDYFRDIDKQVLVNIDLSLSKEEIITQIGELKDEYDNDPSGVFSYQGIERSGKDYGGCFRGDIDPLAFSRSIKRRFGDLLFVYDSTQAGYKRQQIIREVYDYRANACDDPTALTHDTIRKYLAKVDEVMKTIVL